MTPSLNATLKKQTLIEVRCPMLRDERFHAFANRFTVGEYDPHTTAHIACLTVGESCRFRAPISDPTQRGTANLFTRITAQHPGETIDSMGISSPLDHTRQLRQYRQRLTRSSQQTSQQHPTTRFMLPPSRTPPQRIRPSATH